MMITGGTTATTTAIIKQHFVIVFLMGFHLNVGISILTGPTSNRDHYNCRGFDGVLRCNCFIERNDSEVFVIDGPFLNAQAHNLPKIQIEDCRSVHVSTDSIRKLSNLRQLKLTNIKNLVLDRSSLHWDPYGPEGPRDLELPRIQITIERSTVKSIGTMSFRGYVSEIVFDNTVIDNVEQFAFSSFKQIESLVFQRSSFKNVNPQAFKKFSVEHLTMLDTEFDLLPSRSFSDLRVNRQIKIYRCRFGTIKSSAFIVDNVERFEMSESRADTVEGEGFKIVTRGSAPVTFRNNTFGRCKTGAFYGFSKQGDDLKLIKSDFVFSGNVLNARAKDSLKVNETSFDPKIVDVFMNATCDCDGIDTWWTDDDRRWADESHCLKPGEDFYGAGGQMARANLVKVPDFKKHNCGAGALRAYSIVFIVIGVTGSLLIIIGTFLVIYFRRMYQRKKKAEYDAQNSKHNLGLIVPDGRTYRETELHVIVERADLLTTDL